MNEDTYKPYKWICPKCGTIDPPQLAIYTARVFAPTHTSLMGQLHIDYKDWNYEVDDTMPDSLEVLLECTRVGCTGAVCPDRIDGQWSIWEEILDED